MKQHDKNDVARLAAAFATLPADQVVVLIDGFRGNLEDAYALEELFSALPWVIDFLTMRDMASVRELDEQGWRDLSAFIFAAREKTGN